MKNYPKGQLFEAKLHQELRQKFSFIEKDHHGSKRLFLDNSGGSFRLIKAIEAWSEIDQIPDCPERSHIIADELNAIIDEGKQSIAKLVGSNCGYSFLQHTASIGNYEIILTAAEYLPGSNIVTTILEHPSSYDACIKASEKFGKELRVANADPVTGAISEQEILNLVDQDTAFVNLIYASNITGSILNLETLVPKLRTKKPDLYVLTDAVQHAPHHLINFDRIGLDACTFAPYKMFGPRGVGVSFISERFSKLPHKALIGKPESEWSLGSPSPAFYKAITEVVNYIEWLGSNCDDVPGDSPIEIGMNAVFLHEKALLYYMLHGDDEHKGLFDIPGVQVHFLDDGIENKDCILALSFGEEDPRVLTRKYADENVTVYERSAKSIYSKRMIEALGLKGVIRVSPIHIQTIEEMGMFLKVTEKIASLN